MKLSDFDYQLPPELIAQKPANPRDHSRLLVYDRKKKAIEHKFFYNLPDYLNDGDLLVMNNSRVIPARLLGTKKDTGGKLEIFLLRNLGSKKTSSLWLCLIGGKVRQEGQVINFSKKLIATAKRRVGDGTWEVEFDKNRDQVYEIIEKIGQVPLPPYIKKVLDKKDKTAYQTVYADEKKCGSVAAPTAGLHFTKKLLEKIKKQGVGLDYVTLHVGLGTFAPIKTEKLVDHKMHAEYFEINHQVIKDISKTKKVKGRVIAVGTTATRVLETVYSDKNQKKSGETEIFICPGYKFKAIDGLITNFHLPKSSLLVLLSAFIGRDEVMRVYKEAIEKKYRFFSYGDAMLIF